MNKPTVKDLVLGKATNQSGTPSLLAFKDLLSTMPQKVQDGLANEILQIETVAYYDTAGFGAAAAGVAKLFKSDKPKTEGECNLSNGKLDEGKPFVVKFITVEYSDAATGFTVEAIPAAMQADFVLKVDKKELLNVGLHSFKKIQDTNMYMLEIDGKYVPDQKTIEVEINVVAGGNAATANNFRVTLEGSGVQTK